MTMTSAVMIAFLLSALPIVALCIHDPKRLRSVEAKRKGMAPHKRRTFVAAACTPGLVCLLLGNTAAFLIWLGACAIFGWTLAGYCIIGKVHDHRVD